MELLFNVRVLACFGGVLWFWAVVGCRLRGDFLVFRVLMV